MKRWQVRLVVLGTVVAGVVGSIVAGHVRLPGASGRARADTGCTTASLMGAYGGMQVARILTFPPTATTPLPSPIDGASVGVFTFDGTGMVTRSGHTANVGGKVASDPGTGSYAVNTDCTFTIVFSPANGFPEEHYSGVVVASGARAYALGTDAWLVNPITLERQ
jgi:hypothetical protein